MRLLVFTRVVMIQVLLMGLVTSCMDDTPPDHNTNPVVDKKETQIVPASPTTEDVVKIITNDCKYYVLASVESKGKEITIKKRFNSQMKLPCVLAFDTISLGLLKQGNYTVYLLNVDKNPTVADSIASKETLLLTVVR